MMGTDHAMVFSQEVPGVTLTAICDANEERAATVAATYGGDVETDPLALIGRDDVDAVIIASTDETHAPLSLECIRLGKPALCEKPLSPSLEECQQIMEAEMAHGSKLLQLGFMRRFDPSYGEIKGALLNGDLGRAVMMHNFHRNVSSPGVWFKGEHAITNSAPHEFDVTRWVLDTEFTAISAFQPSRSDDAVAPVVMVLESRDGQIVNVEINNNAAYGYDVRGELVGERGSAFLNAPVNAVYHSDLRESIPYSMDHRKRFLEAYRLQNKAFAHFAKTGEFSEIASDCWDGYCATAVANAGAAALAQGSRVAIEMMDQPAFYAKG